MTGSADYFDEMRKPDGGVRDAYAGYCQWFDGQDNALLRRKHAEAETNFRKTGITFNVYGENEAEERLLPFDMVPRVISAAEWRKLTRGIEQRVSALNAFMHDLYHRQEIIRAGRIPERLFSNNAAWLPHMVGFTPPGFTPISSVSTWCAPGPMNSMCWKTMPARRLVSATCWKTARR